MSFFFATKDIEEVGLRARAGLPLAERFQSPLIGRRLQKELGRDVIGEIDPQSDQFVIVATSYIKGLEDEIARLQKENQALSHRPSQEQGGKRRNAN